MALFFPWSVSFFGERHCEGRKDMIIIPILGGGGESSISGSIAHRNRSQGSIDCDERSRRRR